MTHTIIHIPAGGLDSDKQPTIMQVDSLDLKTMQGLVGGHIELVRLDDGIDLWINEEGLLKGLPHNRVFTRADGVEFPIVGDAFIAGSNEEDGETIGLTTEQAFKWLREAQQAPVAITIPAGRFGFGRSQ